MAPPNRLRHPRPTPTSRPAPPREVPHAVRLGAALLAAATAGVGLVAAAPPRPAWAHARLVSTDPAADATVDHQVTSVTLTFNGPVRGEFSTVVVTGADQASHSDGPPRAADRTLTQSVAALPPGPVRVVWRTVSADGHPIEGEFRFTGAWQAPTSAAAPGPGSLVGSAGVSASGTGRPLEQERGQGQATAAGVGPPQPAGDGGPDRLLLLLGGLLLVAAGGALAWWLAWWLPRRRQRIS